MGISRPTITQPMISRPIFAQTILLTESYGTSRFRASIGILIFCPKTSFPYCAKVPNCILLDRHGYSGTFFEGGTFLCIVVAPICVECLVQLSKHFQSVSDISPGFLKMGIHREIS